MISINKKTLTIISAAILLIIVVVFAYSQFSVDTKLPFDKLKKDMSVEAVHQVLGKPKDSDYYKGVLYQDVYNKVRFCGLVGEVCVKYDEEGILDNCNWTFSLPDRKDFDSYDKQIEKIKTYFSNKCGSPQDEFDGTTIWEDESGKYQLHISTNAEYDNLPQTIRVFFIP